MTPAGKAAFKVFYNSHAREQADATDDDLAAAFSKLEGYAARLAPVVHCVRQAAGECVGDAVDEQSIGAGVELVMWFARETQRIYAALSGDEADDELRQLADWIRLRGGRVSPRDLTRSRRAYPDADSARAVLQRLEQAGYGRWVYPAPGPKGGAPAMVFQLSDITDADTTPV